MIQQTLDVLADGIDTHLVTVLAEMPGTDGEPLKRIGDVQVTRHLLDEDAVQALPIGIRLELQDAPSEAWPVEAQDVSTTDLTVGVVCWINRPRVPLLVKASDDEMIRTVRALVRAVSAALRRTFSANPALDRDGVQVRTPTSATLSEPDQGEDGALTIMTLTLSVPVLDYWAQRAGSV